MAGSTPLCSDPCTVDFETPLLEKRFPSLNSKIEEFICDFNSYQFLQALLVSFSALFDSQQTFITVFTDSHPSWHCTNEQLLDQSSCSKGSGSSICQLPRSSWSWDFPVSSSIISEWGLECESFFVTGLPASSFFFGCLVGALALGTLADSSLGRKNMLFLCCLTMSVSSFLTIFSTNIWIYSALRFLCGFAKASISTSYLVLVTELVGKRWRGQVGVIGFFCATIGFATLPAMAYINRGSSWRNMYIWTSIPTIFYSLLVHFFVHESPRWLFVKGRKEEAVAALKILGSVDSTQSTTSLSIYGLQHEEEGSINVDIYSALKILLRKPWALRRLLTIMAIGFGSGMVYYGMPLALGNLSFNLYLSVTFNALSELPAALLTFFLVDNINRRSSIFGFSILSGIFSILSIMKGEIFTNLQIVFELSSFFCGCTAFNILLIYTLELFPTCVRNSAISLLRQAIVFSGVLSPVLVAAGRSHGIFLSYGVFGLVAGTSGFFAVLLPETRGTTLSDTMEEEERKENSVFVDLT